MHLQEGIGRDGYRMLAVVFGLFGLLGLGTTVYAFQPGAGLFNWLGLGLSIVGIGMLFSLLMIVLDGRLVPVAARTDSESSASTMSSSSARPRAIPAAPAPSLMPQGGYEFPDAAPAPGAAPEGLVMPKAFQGGPAGQTGPETVVDLPDRDGDSNSKDPKDWPRRRGKAGITRRELAEKYTRTTPAIREILLNDANNGTMSLAEVPMVVAKTAGPADAPDWTPDGMSRGKCGGCGTVLLAPAERPMKLRCPQCDKVTLLK